MNANVLRAVLARNFLSYFSSPTGYVFICLFVALSSIAAFWPNAFFNDNLANLDQLNAAFPFIMLVFIPAITMGIWAEERRDGTDELLLTIPASDLDIVLGKYLAAVAIFSVSLAFSLATNYLVLNQLASPRGFVLAPAIDVGLMLGTYVGYWLVGLAMLAVGMVASFLTRILTVAYILGALFNAPLVFAARAEAILPTSAAFVLKQWSLSGRMADFGRGVISLTGILYFAAIVAVMLYLSIALIGRRHWSRRGGGLMGVHYTMRAVALVLIGVGLVVLSQRHELRADVTSAQLTRLCAATRQLLADLPGERPVVIEAFISPEVPAEYVQTRTSLIDTLREMEALGRGRVHARIIDTEPATEEAARAESGYKITPREVVNRRRDTISVEKIYLGVSVRCGLNRVTIPFVNRGIPVEYELIRSVSTVLEEKRKRIGVLVTDAPLYGQFNMQTMSAGRNWPIIDELEKQYEVVRVDADGPIDPSRFDVLLAVQPSSLGPEQMDHFIDAVRHGVPTAIFEDPFPVLAGNVPGTGAPRQPPGGMNMMMMMRQPPPPKGEIAKLWALLGVDFDPELIVSQDFNPYPKFKEFPEEFVFVDSSDPEKPAFGMNDPISSGLKQVLFPYPGAIAKLNVSTFEFVPLAQTRDETSTVRPSDVVQMTPYGPVGELNRNPYREKTGAIYCLAAHITGQIEVPPPKEDKKDKKSETKKDAGANAEDKEDGKDTKDAKPEEAKKPKIVKLNVVVVADVDLLTPGIFLLREEGDATGLDVYFDFDNVTFVLNVLDVLAGDDRFLEIRKRRREHDTLVRVDEQTKETRAETADLRRQYANDFERAQKAEEQKLEQQVAKLQKQMEAERMDVQEIMRRVAIFQQAGQKRLDATIERLRRENDRKKQEADIQEKRAIEGVENRYKIMAVLFPPIPPLVLAIAVFCIRRAREREGVARSRLR